MSGKYQAYPEYKDSGVEWLGLIPTEWELWKLKHAFNEIGSGTTPPSGSDEWYGGEIPWVTTGELRETIIVNTAKNITLETIRKFPTLRKYPKGSVAIAMYGATIGRLGILGIEATTNQACCVLTKSDVVNNKYLYYWLQAFRKDIVNLASGGGQPNINQEVVASLKVSSPNLFCQNQITNFLDHETAKIDTLIKKQQQLIKLLKEKRQAVISHAVTKGLNPDVPMRDSGIEWLGEVPEHWAVKKFSHCATIRNGQVDPTKEPYCDFVLIAPNHIESGTGRLLAQETATEQGADSGKYICREGEVIYSKIRPALTKVCISPSDEVICSADMYPIQGMSGLTNEFLFWSLLSTWFTSLVILESDRVAMPKINREKLAEVVIPIPPESEQRQIGTEVRKKTKATDYLIQKTERAISFSKERRTALISAAVTGKIDVRNWQAPAVLSSDKQEAAIEALAE